MSSYSLKLSTMKDRFGALDPVKIEKIARLNGARTFIETGTYLGDTVASVRPLFDRVFSIELSAELYERAVHRFSGDSGVTLLLGDSSTQLLEAVNRAGDPRAIVWLDAHWSGGNTAKADENTPIVQELKAISSTFLDQAIILVDDLRYFINIPPGFEVHEANGGYPLLQDLLSNIRKLWPDRVAWINGDVLLIFPEAVSGGLKVSEVLAATHCLRIGADDEGKRQELEDVIASAEDEERETLLSLPEVFSHSLKYGIGGEYAYWRGLIRERDGALIEAKEDFELGRRCGLRIPARSWE